MTVPPVKQLNIENKISSDFLSNFERRVELLKEKWRSDGWGKLEKPGQGACIRGRRDEHERREAIATKNGAQSGYQEGRTRRGAEGAIVTSPGSGMREIASWSP
jgi:hypothetical protein